MGTEAFKSSPDAFVPSKDYKKSLIDLDSTFFKVKLRAFLLPAFSFSGMIRHTAQANCMSFNNLAT
jgi:hypothetical protein